MRSRNLGPVLVNLGPNLVEPGQIWPVLVERWLTWTGFSPNVKELRHNLGNTGSHSADSGQSFGGVRLKSARTWTIRVKFGRFRAKVAQICPTRPSFGRFRPNLTDAGRIRRMFARCRANFRPPSCNFGRFRPDSGENGRASRLAEFWPTSGEVGPKLNECGAICRIWA